MKTFAFSLESLLTLRAHEENERLLTWATALQEAHAAARECEALRGELAAWQDFRRGQQGQIMVAADLQRNHQAAYEFYLRWVARDRLRQGLERRALDAFGQWQEAHRKKEILGNLRGRAWTRWTKEWERQEQKEIDERAPSMVSRRPAHPLQEGAPQS